MARTWSYTLTDWREELFPPRRGSAGTQARMRNRFRPEVTLLEDRLTPANPNTFGYSASTPEFQNINLQLGQPGVFEVLPTGADEDSVQLSATDTADHFQFYGINYDMTQLFVSENGLISFGQAFTPSFVNCNLKLSSSGALGTFYPTMPVICPYWDDLINNGPDSAVLAQFQGNSLIIQWQEAQQFPATPNGIEFQCILQLNTDPTSIGDKFHAGGIVFNYVSTNFGDPAFNDGGEATVGIKNSDTFPSKGDPLVTWYTDPTYLPNPPLGGPGPVQPPDITIRPRGGTAIEIATFHQDIDGTVFKDQNANGIQDNGEIGLAGVTVFLDVNGTGVLAPNDPQTVTDTSGRYEFDNVAALPGPGTYHVRVVVPAGYRQTTPNPKPGPTIHVVANLGADIGTVLVGLQRTDTLVFATDQGGTPRVTVRFVDNAHNNFTFLAYESTFTGGVRVATADLISQGTGANYNSDGIPDIITAPGPGRVGEVRVFNGAAPGGPVLSLQPFGPNYTGGIFIAVADVTGDGVPDIIMGSGVGITAEVRIFDFANKVFLPTNIFPYGGFRNGVHVAAADMNGDGRAEVVTAPANGMAPTVKVFNVNFNAVTGVDTPVQTASFNAYASNYFGGVWVAATDGLIVTGPGLNSLPVVKVFSGSGLLKGSFQAYSAQQDTNGVRVAILELDDTSQTTGIPDTSLEIATAPGTGSQPLIRYFESTSPFNEFATFGFWGFEPNFTGGVFVAGSSRTPA